MLYRQRYLWLILGTVATVLFMVVCGPLYFRLYLGNPYFTDGLYDFRYTIRMEGIVMRLAFLTIGMAWGAAVLYYYVINSVRFDRWWHWASIAVALMALTPILGFALVASGLDRLEPGLAAEYRDLNLLQQVWTSLLVLVWFVVASFSIRWWSGNCRHTPFPQ